MSSGEQTKLIGADGLSKQAEPNQESAGKQVPSKDAAEDEEVKRAGCSPAFCRFPLSVYFIVTNEFCERFNYFGVRTILTLYLLKFIGLSSDHSTAIFHLFVVVCYFSPIIGGIVADSLLGRFWTIVILSIVYCIGGVVLAATAVPHLGLAGALIGLLLIGLGTGGIKPNVAAFGADQIPEGKAWMREAFFSTFYFAINLGSLLSTILIPVVRSNVYCMDDNCYALAFGIPAVAMALAIVIFIVGKPMYRMVQPGKSVVGQAACCIVSAAKNYRAASVKDADRQFLDYADSDRFPPEFVRDLRQFSRLLLLYIPFPIFWALFDQMGSRWTIQASLMDGYMFWDWSILPDQMQALNSLLILVLIPIFDCCIYPLLSKLHLSTTLCKRMGVGMLLASSAFIAAMAVQMRIDAELPTVPKTGQIKLKFVNSLTGTSSPCGVIFEYDGVTRDLAHLGFSRASLHTKTPHLWNVAMHTSPDCPDTVKRAANLTLPGGNNSYDVIVYGSGRLAAVPAATEKNRKGLSLIRVMLTNPKLADRLLDDKLILRKISRVKEGIDFALNLTASPKSSVAKGDIRFTDYQPVHSGFYSVQLVGNYTGRGEPELPNVGFSNGQIISLVLYEDSDGKIRSFLIEEVRANSVSMMWQVPQYVLISIAEVLFSISGLALSYAEAPASMKSLVQALWLMCVAIGNVVVMVVSEVRIIPYQSYEFLMFALLMLLNVFVFILLAMRYQPFSADPDSELPMVPPTSKPAPLTEQDDKSNVNSGYTAED
ncbi:hypothetical protein BOX15_Mlig010206g1 [Macrostomum lignano]|uniref:MFS domain-containing protein n=2 Tax=Macrostomum lignano TaxID=282301 RepID=A0A1I8IAN9_9PLAT|nr:hypothetical protein BOX15_Mlig010206g1 [Macrostomum lignano]